MSRLWSSSGSCCFGTRCDWNNCFHDSGNQQAAQNPHYRFVSILVGGGDPCRHFIQRDYRFIDDGSCWSPASTCRNDLAYHHEVTGMVASQIGRMLNNIGCSEDNNKGHLDNPLNARSRNDPPDFNLYLRCGVALPVAGRQASTSAQEIRTDADSFQQVRIPLFLLKQRS